MQKIISRKILSHRKITKINDWENKKDYSIGT